MPHVKWMFFKEGLVRQAGGAEKVFVTLVNHLKKRAFDVTVFTFDENDKHSFYEMDPQIEWIRLTQEKVREALPHIPSQLMKRLYIARQEVKKKNPDVLVSFGDTMNIFTLWLGLVTGKKVIIADRNHPRYKKSSLRFRLERALLYPFSHKLVVQTKGVVACYPAHMQKKMEVIPNPLDPMMSVSKSGRLISELRDPKCPLKLLTIAKLLPQKGLDVMIEALGIVNQQYTNWEWMVLGEGEDRKELEQRVFARQLHSKVQFAGVVKDVSLHLDQADIFVLPSRFEGFPNALLEALYHELPVIATRCPFGPEEMIQHGTNGLLVPVDDAKALSEALLCLMENGQMREKLKINTVKSVAPFLVEHIVSMWVHVLTLSGADETISGSLA